VNRAGDVVRKWGGCGRLRGGCCERRADVAHATVLDQRLAEVFGHLPVPTGVRLRKAHKPVRPRQRLLLVTREQRVDPGGGVGRWLGHLDLHRAA
jgi:hypothetical protein